MKVLNQPLPNHYVLKDYQINQLISVGGFSFVYSAIHLITQERIVIKEFMPRSMKVREKGIQIEIKNKQVLKNFEENKKYFFEEMSIISRIRHKNIINILDFFESNGTAYIVMPYEYGSTLNSHLSFMRNNRIKLSEPEIIQIMIEVLEAIHELHINNVLHLDLKPNNLWLRPTKEILILDFGASIDKKNIRQNNFFYTPRYAPPEQYRKEYNNPLDIGVWTDYYCIGTTFFYLLTLKSPPEESIKLQHSLDIRKYCDGNLHYKIYEIINQLCQLEIKQRKLIHIPHFIQELKNIIPYSIAPDENLVDFIFHEH